MALAPQPSRERMVLLLIAVVFGLVFTIGMAVTAATMWFSVSLPYPVRLLVGVTLQVIVMTYWLMPYLTRRLGRWLYPSQPTDERDLRNDCTSGIRDTSRKK